MDNNPSKEEIINKAFQFHSQGNISEAAKFYQYCINQGFNDHRVFSNYGVLLKSLRKLKEAEFCFRKAIQLNPNYPNAYSNLGIILRDLGKLKEAEFSYRKAIQLNPNHTNYHYNLGNILTDLEKLKEAEFSYRKAIQLNPNFAEGHCNLGNLLKSLGKLKEAEFSYRKAIQLNPNFAEGHCNLGNLLRSLGKLRAAELLYVKTIDLDPNFVKAYSYLSTIQSSHKIEKWQTRLLSEDFIKNKSSKEKVFIYFARANILHKEKKYASSSKYLQLANNLKLNLKPSNVEYLLNESKKLLFESNKKIDNKKELKNFPQSIFIVGMPRSGSTLLESILSMNNNVKDLGEVNILEESFLSWKTSKQKLTLAEIYLQKANTHNKELKSTTNKWLYNYQYAGIIGSLIPNAKIIHCFRNPLDNILSIYRANFAEGNQYSSSLVDCAKVYLDQEIVMTKYKKKFKEKIYNLSYDSLVYNPTKEIKSLISWFSWKWEDKYLSPHLNPRSVSTASDVQVRSAINSKSCGSWKNYKELLKPVMEIITQKDKYKELKY